MFWAILRHNTNCIAISDRVMAAIAKNLRGIYILSVLMENGLFANMEYLVAINGFIEDAVISTLHINNAGVSLQTMEAAARWEPDAIEYLQAHARPNVRFTRSVAETASSSSNP